MEKKNGHSYEVDIWSLGVVIYTMLFGVPPFDANDEKVIYKKIKTNSYKFPENIKVENSAKKLISSLTIGEENTTLTVIVLNLLVFIK